MSGLIWKKTMQEAMEDISGGTRLALIFFHDPDEEGSKKTLVETMSDRNVIKLMERDFSPVMVNMKESQDAVKSRHVDWSPTFIVCDETGAELERWVGYLPADDFKAQAILSKGLAALHKGRHEEAAGLFNELISEFPASEFIPEAEYFLGVAAFKDKGETDKLVEVCHELSAKYPESLWTKRCSIWSHINIRHPFVDYNAGGTTGSGAY
ncbi:MAG: thioredoxin fold domain-containing protein [Deltaproteobacteria bacterium]|nr:thioredoxin fold domain-containing protein [Deltaproteobacteria bacterium]